ncbi:MAG: GNAT family N-acetyltransferase [Bacilli bacterium]|nr:GNAT family N-acetyltransferase [Bacilli bacterium]
MNYELKIINIDMAHDVYEMYKDIPFKEVGSTNIIKNQTYEQFKKQLKEFKNEENIKNEHLDTTTNRYIFYLNNIPIGEIGIRTTLNDFWINRGSQIFYKLRYYYRHKGYGTKMLELALIECKKLGMKQVRVNCSDTNIASKRIIEKNGGTIDIKNYKNKDGYSSSYIIKLEEI